MILAQLIDNALKLKAIISVYPINWTIVLS